jgi:tetratricopeptide (TPR) repeat protein
MNPNAEETYRILGVALALEGEYQESERVLREAAEMPEAGSYTLASLGYSLARAGKTSEARAILTLLEAQRRESYVSPVAFGTIFLGLGDAEHALDWAEVALEERRGWLVYLKVNPLMDPMRGHPRFEALVRQMKL